MEPGQEPRIYRRSTRNRPRKRNRDYDLYLAYWNVNTMLQPGKMAEIIDELTKYNMKIAALQELRWKEQGEIKKKYYSIYYSGSENQGLYGTGFYVNNQVRNSIIGFEPVSDRICVLKIKGKFQNITFVSVYAPTNNANDEEKDLFYDELSKICEKTSKHDVLVVAGDYNAKVGRESFIRQVAGLHSLHDETSENGIRLVNFALENNLWISSVSFKHKRIHKYTWKIPGGGNNQIDHILVDRRHATTILDVKSCRGADCDSDHYLIWVKFRQRISNETTRNSYKRVKWNTDKLADDRIRADYQTKINEKFQNVDIFQGSSENWQVIEQTIKDAAMEIIGHRSRRNENNWYDTECKRVNELKHEAWKKYVNRATRRNLRRKKREALNAKVLELEQNSKSHIRNFYRGIKNQTTPYQPRLGICRNSSNEIIIVGEKILDRWEEYFTELFKKSDYENELNENFAPISSAENRVEEPSIDETKDAIHKLKNNKASGEDSITAELIKYGGDAVLQKIHELIILIWKNEDIPDSWNSTLIFPVHKKGDKKECRNYRGIFLLNTAYKVFTNILYDRIGSIAEEVITEYQCGFRKNKSTTDQCFILSQIFEKFNEFSRDVHCLFIDFKQAFDSINREKIFGVMQRFGIPEKLIRLTCITLKDTSAQVLVQGKLTTPFPIESGVKQGYALSSLIFNLMLHYALKDIGTDKTIFTRSVQMCAYADDMVIIARNVRILKDTFLKLERNTNNIGLSINEQKTKYFVKARNLRGTQSLNIGNYKFESVPQIKYLGVIFSSSDDSTSAIKERISAANKCFYTHSKLIRSKLLSIRSKLSIYRTLIKPVLTYGCECWTLKTSDSNLLSVFERKMLRKIYGPVRNEDGTYRIRNNNELEELIKHQTVIRYIKAQRIRWLGHVIRMPEDSKAQIILNRKEYGTQARGRPKMRRIDSVVDDLKIMNVNNYITAAKDREIWKRIVQEALVHMGLLMAILTVRRGYGPIFFEQIPYP
ncbi:uncharacterized protein LOC129605867 [Condylostylus longicornis]|uniref:uncharacterized protein LOC129605867 n=1 Tax=Condylostylus longicornis TaxID=2530218 RepID=UPI00244DBF92|nr:uncharacterized protein LOC129605867 [Condylostylus longicornis]